MGIESVLASFKGNTGTPEGLVHSLGTIIPVIPNPSAEMDDESSCWVLDDGQHKLEMEIQLEPSMFFLRFALCNPRSVDQVFLKLIRYIMLQHNLSMRFCEDCEEVPEWFTAPDMVDQWETEILRCIESKRQLWHHEFGQEELSATCAEAFERFIMPRGTLNL